MFSRQTVLAVLAASAALMSADAFAPAAPISLSVSFTCLVGRHYSFVEYLTSATSNVWINNHQRGSSSVFRVKEDLWRRQLT